MDVNPDFYLTETGSLVLDLCVYSCHELWGVSCIGLSSHCRVTAMGSVLLRLALLWALGSGLTSLDLLRPLSSLKALFSLSDRKLRQSVTKN